jgi:Protein of unknown function DUF262/Protein of unknown function (DUF1524)
MPISTFKFDQIGIAKVLEQEWLKVPLNQREYSWEQKHVNDLFQDFAKSISKNAYFLGTIVLTELPSKDFLVVDGQQRLATTTILIAAIRDYFFQKNETALSGSVETDFLFKLDRPTGERKPRLSLNVDDNEYFRTQILANRSEKGALLATKESHKRLSDAYRIAREQVEKIIAPYAENNRKDQLNSWLDFLSNSAQVILLKVPDSNSAYVMFETLNDRGLKVSQADLVKSYMFGEAGVREPEAHQSWALMIGALETVDQDDLTINFLRHICSALYGLTRAREVFEIIKGKVSGTVNAVSFLNNLRIYSTDYSAMLCVSHEKWNKYPPGVRNSIQTLNDLNVQSIRPLMFSVSHKFSEREAEKAFRMFIAWTIRFFVCGGSTSGVTEEAYAKAAKKIMDGTITRCEQLLSEMEKFIASDTEFKESFATLKVSKEYLARYYLRSLETTIRQQPNPSWVINQDTAAVNLEHVMPKNFKNWTALDDETASAYLKRLGNLALLESAKNTTAGDSPFDQRKGVYTSSGFKLTEMIGECGTWGITEITERQAKMAEYATKTWPLMAE